MHLQINWNVLFHNQTKYQTFVSLNKVCRAEMPDGIDVNSRVLGKWLNDPVVTRSLARRGLMEVAAKFEVEIGRDYALERDALKRNGSV